MKIFRRAVVALGAAMLLAPLTATAQLTVDPELSRCEKVSGVSGNLSSVGSDTLAT